MRMRALASGIERGDLRPDTDPRLIQELLIGPIYFRLFFSGPPFDRKLGTRPVDAILDGCRIRPEKTRATSAQVRQR